MDIFYWVTISILFVGAIVLLIAWRDTVRDLKIAERKLDSAGKSLATSSSSYVQLKILALSLIDSDAQIYDKTFQRWFKESMQALPEDERTTAALSNVNNYISIERQARKAKIKQMEPKPEGYEEYQTVAEMAEEANEHCRQVWAERDAALKLGKEAWDSSPPSHRQVDPGKAFADGYVKGMERMTKHRDEEEIG